MLGSSLIALLCLLFSFPADLHADENLEVLEAVAAASAQVQPGLDSYLATVETKRLEEILTRMTNAVPADLTPPVPEILKYWQRNGRVVFFARESAPSPYVEQLIKLLTDNLAVEPGEMLLPLKRAEQRRQLVQAASTKLSEVALADKLIKRLEITFAMPTNLGGAFYSAAAYLPENHVTALVLDIDTDTHTVSEIQVVSDSGLHLTAEIRYIAVTNGYLPERLKITSPDGAIDDLFEIKFSEIDGYFLPTTMQRSNRSPGHEQDLKVVFKNLRVNQPVPDDIKAHLEQQ